MALWLTLGISRQLKVVLWEQSVYMALLAPSCCTQKNREHPFPCHFISGKQKFIKKINMVRLVVIFFKTNKFEIYAWFLWEEICCCSYHVEIISDASIVSFPSDYMPDGFKRNESIQTQTLDWALVAKKRSQFVQKTSKQVIQFSLTKNSRQHR